VRTQAQDSEKAGCQMTHAQEEKEERRRDKLKKSNLNRRRRREGTEQFEKCVQFGATQIVFFF
jgi:hypothetical protein